jgi:hypothetical protein
MRALAALLTRWPWTLHLASLERALRAELDLRARCAAIGRRSPHQIPPPTGRLLWLALALLAAHPLGQAIAWALR